MFEIILKEDGIDCGRVIATRVGRQVRGIILEGGRVPGRLTMVHAQAEESSLSNLLTEKEYAFKLLETWKND